MDFRFRLTLITSVALLVLAVWTLPEWWTVLNPGSILAEEIPGLELEVQEQFVLLPNAQRDAYLTLFEGDEDAEIEAKPELARVLLRSRFLTEDRAAPEATELFEPPIGAVVEATGEFVPVNEIRGAQGEVTIYRLPDGSRLLRLEESFTSTRAPDVHIIITRNPDPLDERGVGVDYIDFGVLRANVGAQNYVVPQSADFSRYPVMALYMPRYDAVLATLTLR